MNEKKIQTVPKVLEQKQLILKKFDPIYSVVNVRLKTSNNKHLIDLILNSPIIKLSQPEKLI